MRTALDNYLGIHPQALALEAQRTQLLAANLANADTPNYKARDLDFKAALAAAGSDAGVGAAANPASGDGATLSTVPDADLKYRVPLAPSLDGNTVDEQLEESAFADNSVRYQATLAFLNSKLRDLMTAISGQ